MKRAIIVMLTILALMMVGCKSESVNPQTMPDWDYINATSEDTHVYFCSGDSGCYSDGSIESYLLMREWKEKHNW